MKTLIVILFASSVAFAACPKNQIEYEGTCADLPAPSEQALAPMIPTSTEKPPSDKMPSYEREGINAVNPPSLAAKDMETDRNNRCADLKGKKSAKLKLEQDDQDFFDEWCKKAPVQVGE